MVPAADRVEAAEIRIGRALDEVEALASMPVDTMGFLINPDIPDHERRARREAREELPEPSLHTSSVDLAAVEAQFLAATSNGPVSLTPSTRTATPAGSRVPRGGGARPPRTRRPSRLRRPPSGTPSSPRANSTSSPTRKSRRLSTAESAERAGGFGESGAPASSEAEEQPRGRARTRDGSRAARRPRGDERRERLAGLGARDGH